jgi:hypothetical protein
MNDEEQSEDAIKFNRRFKYAIIVYAIIEFIAIAFFVYYTPDRR